jgi:hypothetical protein
MLPLHCLIPFVSLHVMKNDQKHVKWVLKETRFRAQPNSHISQHLKSNLSQYLRYEKWFRQHNGSQQLYLWSKLDNILFT